MRLLWLIRKQLDVAMDKATWVEMVKALEAAGHEVTLVAGYRQSPSPIDGIRRLEYAPAATTKYLHYASFSATAPIVAARLLRHESFDGIISDPGSVDLAWAARSLAHCGNTPIVMDVRTLPVQYHGASARLKPALFGLGVLLGSRLADGFSVITDAMLTELRSRYHLSAAKPTSIWTSGVSTSHFDPRKVDLMVVNDLRKRLRLERRFVFMYHGTVTLERNLGSLVEATALVQSNGHPEVALVIVGDGPDMTALREMANRGAMVRVLPAVAYDRIPEYLALSDAGVLPFGNDIGWSVSSPIKLFEYLAMRRIVVATPIRAHQDVLRGRSFGVLTQGGSPAQLAEGMDRLLALPPSERELRGRAARDMVKDEYSWDTQATRLAALVARVAQ